MEATIAELRTALSEYAQVIGVFGAEVEARETLIRLRSLKTTWVGKDENDLRFAIDRALRGELDPELETK